MSCDCTGIRFCAQCYHGERVQSALLGQTALRHADDVIANQVTDDRTSSCSFAVLGPSKYSMCINCDQVFVSESVIRGCYDHDGEGAVVGMSIPGLFVVRNCITADTETNLIRFLDAPGEPFPPWKTSQSGRRKHEFGPQKNFKKMKVNSSHFVAMPVALKDVISTISSMAKNLTHTNHVVAEASALEYTAENMSNFDPHIDDTWLWGERIIGINLLEDCAITFVNSSGTAIDVYLPRYCFFMMSGECRHRWMHGIRPGNVAHRRISVTLRELSASIMETHPKECEQILQAARTFV